MHHLFSYLLINCTHLLAIEKPLAKRSIFPVTEYLWFLHGCLMQLQCLLHSPHFIWTCRHTISYHFQKNSECNIITNSRFLCRSTFTCDFLCVVIFAPFYILLLLLITYCDKLIYKLQQTGLSTVWSSQLFATYPPWVFRELLLFLRYLCTYQVFTFTNFWAKCCAY